jgi:hypothetical protein
MTGTAGSREHWIGWPQVNAFDRVRAGGVNRSGVWRAPRVRTPWPTLDTVSSPEQAASDRAAICADVAL